ncbi:unnamed protein product [Brachionus calyciflorus]|uniref:Uncharacterized protein n=1 Tax=Brachionus calyciflorus TaxID=104777 RepID=A0A814B573_9BILA|nr:unnamed protein product [Brachionus calyciflorus]
MIPSQFKISPCFSILVLISICLIFNQVCPISTAPKAKVHKNIPKLNNNRFMFNTKRNFEPIDDVNRCILACGKCADDLYVHDEKEDIENTPSIQCANECLEPKAIHKDFNEAIAFNLLSNKLFDKNFVKCFLNEMIADYNY